MSFSKRTADQKRCAPQKKNSNITDIPFLSFVLFFKIFFSEAKSFSLQYVIKNCQFQRIHNFVQSKNLFFVRLKKKKRFFRCGVKKTVKSILKTRQTYGITGSYTKERKKSFYFIYLH